MVLQTNINEERLITKHRNSLVLQVHLATCCNDYLSILIVIMTCIKVQGLESNPEFLLQIVQPFVSGMLKLLSQVKDFLFQLYFLGYFAFINKTQKRDRKCWKRNTNCRNKTYIYGAIAPISAPITKKFWHILMPFDNYRNRNCCKQCFTLNCITLLHYSPGIMHISSF